MSVEQVDVVDVTSINSQTGEVVLTVSDHLDWSDTVAHQTALQNKFNAYLAFVESGELLKRYPDAVGLSVVFNVVFKFRPDREGVQFMNRAQQVIESAGFRLSQELFADSYNN
jgi:hypothetical protein